MLQINYEVLRKSQEVLVREARARSGKVRDVVNCGRQAAGARQPARAPSNPAVNPDQRGTLTDTTAL